MEKLYHPLKMWKLGGAEEHSLEERIPISSGAGVKSALEDGKRAALEQTEREGRKVDRTDAKVEGMPADLAKQELPMRGE